MATSPGASFTISKPTGVVAGDIMIINIANYNVSSLPACSGWTLISSANLTDGYGYLLYLVAGGSEPASYTFTNIGSPTYINATLVAFSGVQVTGGYLVGGGAGGPFDVAPGSILYTPGCVTTVPAASITTNTANAAVIMFGMGPYNPGVWSAWSTTNLGSLTQLYSNPWVTGDYTTTGAAWKTMATAGATGAGTATLSLCDYPGAMLIALRYTLPCTTPTTYSVTGGGSFCSAGTVGLSGSQVGVTYQLYLGASPSGGTTAGTGSALSWTGLAAGTYTVQTTTAGGYCAITMTGSAVVSVLSSPQTFSYTGGVQTFTVPSGVTTLTVNVSGAQGGNGSAYNGTNYVETGGNGGNVQGTITVTPGDILDIYVGGQGGSGVGHTCTFGSGGYNGGGSGYAKCSSSGGGGGGGASDIRVSPYALANRVVVAGGGGGGGGNNYTTNYEAGGPGGAASAAAGAGYGNNSQNNTSWGTGSGANGNNSTTPGVGGAFAGYCTSGSGTLGTGGNTCTTNQNGGGGGGGGYYGGGAGTWSGGGGGNDYTTGMASVTSTTAGSQAGNGSVVISWSCCSTPTSSAATSVTTTGATANWSGGTSSYIVEYGAHNFTPGTAGSAGKAELLLAYPRVLLHRQ